MARVKMRGTFATLLAFLLLVSGVVPSGIFQLEDYEALANTSPSVTQYINANIVENSVAASGAAIAPSLTVETNVAPINSSSSINGATVVISTNFDSGKDSLSYTGSLPSGVSVTAFNTSTGVLRFNGSTTPANWQALLRTVRYTTTSTNNAVRTVRFTLGHAIPLELSSGQVNYYEVVNTKMTWNNARSAAEGRQTAGVLSGYLATLNTQAEDNHLARFFGVQGWLGGSDEFSRINSAVGSTLFANQGASEGKYYWVTGPAAERGANFSDGNSPNVSVPQNQFARWANGEPNNTSSEHFVEYVSGGWVDRKENNTSTYTYGCGFLNLGTCTGTNDNNPANYYVEYSGATASLSTKVEVYRTLSVDYEENGGSLVNSETVRAGQTATEPAAPSKSGYAFMGWFTDAGLTSAYSFSAPVTGNLTLYAKWVAYTVSFVSNGGNAASSQLVLPNQLATAPAVTRSNYVLEGWYTNSALTQAFSFATPVNSDLTLYAKWRPNGVFGQDGYGYSGIVANPKSVNNPLMTGYNTWPSGFTKGFDSFFGGVYDGTNIWMVPSTGNQVVRVNPSTGAMTGFSSWPSGYTKGAEAFSGGAYDGTYIWLAPYNADRVIRVHATTGVMTGYNTWPSGFTKGSDAFSGAVYDGTYVWLIPEDADRIIRVTPSTGAMVGYNSWPAGFTKYAGSFKGGVFDGTYIWLIPKVFVYSQSGILVRFDPATGAMVGYNSWPAGFVHNTYAFAGGVIEGDNLWLAPSNGNMVVKVNRFTGTMTGYNSWPAGYNKTSTGSDFGGAVYDGNSIWLIPDRSNHLVQVNPATGAMTSHQGWPTGGSGGYAYSDWSPGPKAGGAVYDGTNIWLIPNHASQLVKASTRYAVQFNSNGGSAVSTAYVNPDVAVAQPSAPTRSGFVFSGWFSDVSLTTPYNFSAPVPNDLTLYAKWQVSVTFVTNSTTSIATQTLDIGSLATAPTAPTKNAHTFIGWFTNAGLTQPFDFSSPVTSNTTLYAKWTTSGTTVQDGFGFSIGVSGLTPLSHLSMTSYTLPFTYGSDDRFSAAVSDGTYLWLVPMDHPYLVRVNEATGELKHYHLLINNSGNPKFSAGVFDGENVWLIPQQAEKVVKVNVTTEAITYYDGWPSGFNKQSSTMNTFVSGVYDGRYVWMIPTGTGANRIIRINPADGAMTSYSDWPSLANYYSDNFSGAIYDGSHIWLIPDSGSSLVKFNPADGSMTSHGTWPAGFTKTTLTGFAGGTFDGTHLWLAPADHTTIVVKVDVQSGEMTGYSSWPTGYTKSTFDKFKGAFYDGAHVWLIPNVNNYAMIRIHPTTGAMSAFSNIHGGTISSGFAGATYDGANLWLIPEDNNLLVKISERKFNVMFHTNGAGSVATQMLTYGQTATQPTQPTKAGYTFQGWYTSQGAYDFSTPVTDDVAIYAKWNEFYLQNGTSFTGTVVTPAPLVNLTASGFNSWPSGFTKGTDDFTGAVDDGTNLWLIPNKSSKSLVKMNKSTGVMTAYSSWPAGFTWSGFGNNFAGGVFDGTHVWLIPSNANQIVKVDASTGSMSSVSYTSFESSNRFAGGVFDGRYVWLAPHYENSILRFDPADNSVKSFALPSEIASFTNLPMFSSVLYDGIHLWLTPAGLSHPLNRVYKMNTQTGSFTGYNQWPSDYSAMKFASSAYDGQNIWLVPGAGSLSDHNALVKLNPTNGMMTAFTNWPNNCSIGAYLGTTGSVFDGTYLWVAARDSCLVRVDVSDGSMSTFNSWPSGFNSNPFGDAFTDLLYDGRAGWVIPYEADRVIKLTPTFTVAFNSNGGSAVASQARAFGQTVTQPANPTRSGFTFGGWFSDSGLTSAHSFSTAVNGPLTLYAKWTASVTFDTRGGSAVTTQLLAAGATVSEPTAPTRAGYQFVGWYSDAELNNAYDFSTPVSAGFTLYAKWLLSTNGIILQNGNSYSRFTTSYSQITEPTLASYNILTSTGMSIWQSSFVDAVDTGTHVWFVPQGRIDQLLKVNKANGTMTTIDLEINETWIDDFSGAVYDGTSIWLIPDGTNKIYKVNATTHEIVTITTIPGCLSSCYLYFAGGIYDGQYVWLFPKSDRFYSHANGFLRIDPNTNAINKYTSWPASVQAAEYAANYSHGVYDGLNIWLIPAAHNNGSIVKFNTVTHSMTTYSERTALNSLTFYVSALFDGSHIWMVPNSTAKPLVKITVADGTVSEVSNWASAIHIEHGPTSYGIIDATYDGRDIWVSYGQSNFNMQSALLRYRISNGQLSAYNKTTVINNDLVGTKPFNRLIFAGDSIWLMPDSQNLLYKMTSGRTVSFESNGGTALSPIQADTQGRVTLYRGYSSEYAWPWRAANYVFKGWFTDVALTTPFVEYRAGALNWTTVSSDLTLYAKWARVVIPTAQISGNTIDLGWDEFEGATTYNVYLNGQLVASGLTSRTYTFTTSAWKWDQLYYAQVSAVVDGVEGSLSNNTYMYRPSADDVRLISSGWQHGVATMGNGTVEEWGSNTMNQLGKPQNLSDVVAVKAGRFHNLALKTNGTVVAWGRNGDGQTNVPNGLKDIVAIAAGGYHSLALRYDSTVIAWGFNGNETTNAAVATVPSDLENVVAIAAGTFHSLALKADGTVVGWGLNTNGQVTIPEGLSGVVAIAANGNHSLALKADGTVVAWGANESGQTNVPSTLNGVSAIAAGGQHSIALKSNGTVVAWGRNTNNQVAGVSALSNILDIAGGATYTMYLNSNQTVETTIALQPVDTLIPAVLGGDRLAPTVPSGVAVSNARPTGFKVSWNASTDNVAVTGYRVFVNGVVTRTLPANVLEVELFGLTSGANFSVQVLAFDKKNNVSALSAPISVSTPDIIPPTTPSNLTVALLSATGFRLNWTASTDNVAVKGYNIYRDGVLIDTVTTTTYRFAGLTELQSYNIEVMAVDTSNNRSAKALRNVTTIDMTPPTVPTNVTATQVTKDKIFVTWTPSTDNVGVTGYNVFLNGVYVKTVPRAETEFLGLASSTAYSIRLQAVDAAKNRSGMTDAISATTLDGIAPTIPTGLTLSNVTKTGFRVSWNASTDNQVVAKYNVYRNGVYVQTVLGTNYTFSGLPFNLSHQIRVQAIDNAGNRSDQSIVLNAATTYTVDPIAPTAPTTVNSSLITSTGFRITWSPASDNVAVTHYNIYRNGTYVATVAGIVNNYTFKNMTANTTSSITIRAVDAEKNLSVPTTALSVTTLQ